MEEIASGDGELSFVGCVGHPSGSAAIVDSCTGQEVGLRSSSKYLPTLHFTIL